MKIGIISSGTDVLTLFRFLNNYAVEFFVYMDTASAPYGDLHFPKATEQIQQGISRLQSQGIDKIILPPVHELAVLHADQQDLEQWGWDKAYYAKIKKLILPLFSRYLQEQVFAYSLIGKIGIFGDAEDVNIAQNLIAKLAQSYELSVAQRNTKRFHFPFSYRTKETSILKHLLARWSWKSVLTNTTIKDELRIFKDAMVDSLVPLNYSTFNAEKTIVKFLNFKKIRFHGLAKLAAIFEQEFRSYVTWSVDESSGIGEYRILVHSTDSAYPLTSQKRLLRILQKGKTTQIQRC